jgi:hypothetical protein
VSRARRVGRGGAVENEFHIRHMLGPDADG